MKTGTQKFIGLLLGVLLFVFGIHLLSLNAFGEPLFNHKIVWTYVVNFILAVLILWMVERNMKAKSPQAGFVFLAGSMLKFIIFFLVFYPSYKANGTMETIEFITFFVPYATCLALEVWYLSKQLNNESLQGTKPPEKNT